MSKRSVIEIGCTMRVLGPLQRCRCSKNASTSQRRTVLANLPIWMTGTTCAENIGAMKPVRLFRQGLKVLYSETICGVDGAAKFRPGLQSSSSRIEWESNIVTQTLNTLIVNSYLAWRFLRMGDVGGGNGTEFESVDECRRNVNVVEQFSDFTYETSKSFLTFTTTLGIDATGLAVVTMIGATDPAPELRHF